MFKVGFTQQALTDPERSDWSGQGPRPLNCSLWYPAEDGADDALVLLPPNDPVMVLGRVAVDAAVLASDKELPVVLLSHGTGGAASGLGWLAGHLAAEGYVVIGVDHHGNTAVEPYRAEGFLCWWERARDLTVALDALSVEGPLAGRLNLVRVGAAGFSLGGYTALALAGAVTEMTRFRDWAEGQEGGGGPREFPDLTDHVAPLLETSAMFRESWQRQSESYRDARVKRVLTLAPAPPVRGFTPESLGAIDFPVAIVAGGTDREAPADPCARWLHSLLPDSRLDVLGPDVGHYAFLCEGTARGRKLDPDVWDDPPGVDRRQVHDQVCAIASQAL